VNSSHVQKNAVEVSANGSERFSKSLRATVRDVQRFKTPGAVIHAPAQFNVNQAYGPSGQSAPHHVMVGSQNGQGQLHSLQNLAEFHVGIWSQRATVISSHALPNVNSLTGVNGQAAQRLVVAVKRSELAHCLKTLTTWGRNVVPSTKWRVAMLNHVLFTASLVSGQTGVNAANSAMVVFSLQHAKLWFHLCLVAAHVALLKGLVDATCMLVLSIVLHHHGTHGNNAARSVVVASRAEVDLF